MEYFNVMPMRCRVRTGTALIAVFHGLADQRWERVRHSGIIHSMAGDPSKTVERLSGRYPAARKLSGRLASGCSLIQVMLPCPDYDGHPGSGLFAQEGAGIGAGIDGQ